MTTYRVLLPHPLEPRLMLLQAHGEWRLPQWVDAQEHDWQVTDHVNRAVAARFGAETTVLRCVQDVHDPSSGNITRVYDLENHSAVHDMPLAATWVGAHEIDGVPIQDPELREIIKDWFAHRTGVLPPRGAPWMQPGWYVQALAWAVARLRDLGANLTRTPEQLRAWERSFLLRLYGTGGNYYFKAAPGVFRHEPALGEWLSRHHPRNSAEVIGVDYERYWFVQREVTGAATPLQEVREETLWEDAVRQLAVIQRDSTQHVPELKRLGCPNRALDVLARRIPRLIADTPAMLLGHEAGLSRAQIERVSALTPTLLALCEELANYPIPDALEHGDLVSANILMTMHGPVYLDWSDSSLSHPFFSLVHLLRDAASLLPESSADSRRRLREAYLEPWRDFAPIEDLRRAFDIARVLAPIHLAATAHAELLPAAGHRWELESAVPTYLHSALDLLLEETA